MQTEKWRRVRTLSSYVLTIRQWQVGKAPDIMELLPLPGDPPKAAPTITISDDEMALRKYKLKKAHRVTFNDEFETLVREHWKPEWGPHPDELQKKAAGQDA